MRLSIFALLSLSLGLAAAKKSPQEELTALAAAGNGVISVTDERTFDLLTLPNRNWSAAIQFTALDSKRRCGPCKEFDPSFNKWVWAVGTIVTSLIMTSGYMFTRIRGMPMSSGGHWIAPGYQSQYGQETQVVAVICKCSLSALIVRCSELF
ncbi:hypothetical protein HWV62_7034 [Athelia sp. TMB]|nr:hypothetical protein HWV62_7034 [Athelia sp. TMB]